MKISWLISVWTLIAVIQSLLADQTFAAISVGGTFGHTLREPKYKIEFHSAESPYHPDPDQESIMMSDSRGRKSVCFLPTVDEKKTGTSTPQLNISSIVVESGRQIKLKTPDELMEVMRDHCWTRQEGWWHFEFCHLKQLRQFHLGADGKVNQEFILGMYDPEATAQFNLDRSDISTFKDPRSKDASQRYHAHQYTNGTICDLTNQPRETEVRFVCAESSVLISSVKEISTCKYAITVHCPMLCKHPMFQEQRPVWHTINCNEMPMDEGTRDAETGDSFKEDIEIAMITKAQVSASDDQEQYAT